jgi:hypothetical protein
MKNKVLVMGAGLLLQACATPEFRPEGGFVPDAATAIQIAEAVWAPIYGREKIETEKPFNVTLENEVWTVTGTMPTGLSGGVATARISKRNGRILEIFHGK